MILLLDVSRFTTVSPVFTFGPADEYGRFGATPMDQEHERRAPRYVFKAPAEIIVQQTGARIEARVKELSLHGCYLDALTPLNATTAVLVKIFSPKDYFEAPATVVYTNPTLGMGLAFRSIKPGVQSVLQKWLLEAITKNREL